MSNGIKIKSEEVYENRIHELADDYIENLKVSENYTDEEVKMLMRKTQPFKGMLKYIFKHLFKIRKGDVKYNNKNSRIDYNDVETLEKLWDLYAELCYRYLQNPTIMNFSLMTGIDYETFATWANGEYRGGNAGAASSAHSAAVKRWRKECECALADTAMTGNPGAMFLLKSKYGYTESPQQIRVVGNRLPDETAADIAARHLGGSMQLPELPELE